MPLPQDAHLPPPIAIGQSALTTVHQFSYLRSTICPGSKLNKELDSRLAKASSAFGRLHKTVWNTETSKEDTGVSLYGADVWTTLLYGAESWVAYHCHLPFFERFHSSATTPSLTPTGVTSSSTMKSSNRQKLIA